MAIVLNMIVKNEAHCIRRCLESVLPYINAAVIIDTGSTDGTQELISDVLWEIEHHVLERPWKNFGFNRTQALEEARRYAKYRGNAILMDADEEFIPGPNFLMTGFSCGRSKRVAEYVWHTVPAGQYRRPFMLPLDVSWSWEGVLHEYLKEPHEPWFLENCSVKDHFDSARNQQGLEAKYLTDAAVLIDQPLTPRNIFYIAESYRGARKYDLALRWYRIRFNEGGDDEERWWSAFMVAHLEELLEYPEGEVIRDYVIACSTRPSRAETYVEFAKFLWKKGHKDASRDTFNKAMRLPMTTDSLNVNPKCYREVLEKIAREGVRY